MTELNYGLAGAEIFLAVATMVVMLAGLFADEEKTPLSHRLSLLVVAVTAVIAIGDFPSGFEIMLSLYPQVQPENKEIVKARMLEYFEIGGPKDESVKSARARLATLIY